MKPLILWGGTDIGSYLYNENPHTMNDKPDQDRDTREVKLFLSAIEEKRSVIGVCRGAQLLCALQGGSLLQHVPEHKNNNHAVEVIVSYKHPLNYSARIFNVAADHHQVMVPKQGEILAWSDFDNAPEVVWWEKTRCLGVQPHPEWMDSDHSFNIWLNKLLVKLEIDHQF